MDNVHLVWEIGLVLVAAFLGGMLCRMLRLPVLAGFLLAGIAIGPFTPGLIADVDAVSAIANLGVLLLMFAVGVQFSLRELGSVKRTALLGGTFQILGTIGLGIGLGLWFGWGLVGGTFLGAALALSSTAVIMRVLEERGQLGTTHGGIMLGISIVQDLSLVLMVSLLPALGAMSQEGPLVLSEVGVAVLRATLFIGGTLILAIYSIPRLIEVVVRTGSQELFLLVIVCISIIAAALAEGAGLGFALGAFLAGIMISESPYSHEVFTQIRPLRDVFAAVFFVSIGMLLNPAFVAANWTIVLAVVLAILLGKGLLSAIGVLICGWHGRTAILVGLGLAQIGEFSFVLAMEGVNRGLVQPEVTNTILSSALVTIFLAPFVIRSGDTLFAWANRIGPLSALLNRHAIRHGLSSHVEHRPRVLILGGGRVGRYVAEAMMAKGIEHLVVDYDAEAILRLREEGVRLLYGDASSRAVLEQIDLSRAELAVVALPEPRSTEAAIKIVKQLAPKLPVAARVRRGIDIPRMRKAGADVVVHGEFESGAEMIRQCLHRMGVPERAVRQYLEDVRQHRYRESE
jgi:monovalent cation:H+ antiporter-2, CPA2 family